MKSGFELAIMRYLGGYDDATQKILIGVILEEQKLIDMDKPNIKPRVRDIVDEHVRMAAAE